MDPLYHVANTWNYTALVPSTTSAYGAGFYEVIARYQSNYSYVRIVFNKGFERDSNDQWISGQSIEIASLSAYQKDISLRRVANVGRVYWTEQGNTGSSNHIDSYVWTDGSSGDGQVYRSTDRNVSQNKAAICSDGKALYRLSVADASVDNWKIEIAQIDLETQIMDRDVSWVEVLLVDLILVVNRTCKVTALVIRLCATTAIVTH